MLISTSDDDSVCPGVSGVTPIPPSSTSPAFDSTPITHTSASQQGDEQTRKLIEARVFETGREIETDRRPATWLLMLGSQIGVMINIPDATWLGFIRNRISIEN
jgi:hypothetical protein